MGIKKLELTTKRSNFWYILPIVLGLLGGVIAYFYLRKSDSKKAKICLVLGTGISVAYFIYIGTDSSTSTDNTPELTTEPREREIQAAREAEEARYQAELERQRELEEARYQAELERQRELEKTSKFDPALIKNSKKNIPVFQNFFRTVLTECRNVDSYSDYQSFLIVMAVMGEEMIEQVNEVNRLLTALELQGYDEHPEVGPLISETRQLATTTSNCLEDMQYIYGN